ncbi:MAG: Probable low-affinity inorganic phosphate transporter [uncultured Chloroflexi bacterium]|uniref:Probable low-affinity inorganic phosphate transporter n=1 Tax=uncultured Chloroflexota bacterium TaxID=166587 RepID=A0A6J4JVB6_9CHLR|nr:MAG: Probable low-affinity inorganic phosphate transporter [uncultured Chloroflexota bacterium]
MPEGVSWVIVLVLLLVLAAEFVNGWTDAPNAIATVVSTRVLSPGAAVLLAVVLNTLGALSGTAVAATIGKGFVDPQDVTPATVGAAMTGIILWSTFAWRLGLPTSESHALVAGLTGAVIATAGVDRVRWEGWTKVGEGILYSTFLGFGVSMVIMIAIYWLFRRVAPSLVRSIFSRAQIASAAFMAFSHGSNDAQKFMGAFTLTLVAGGILPEFEVPLWVILLCATTMGIGTATGGWRIIHTLGTRMTRLEPVHGFAAETGAATVIEVASRFGIPLSTTHTISTAIMGVGATQRLSAVRWGVAGEMVMAWVVTFPVCAAIGWATGMLFKLLGVP